MKMIMQMRLLACSLVLSLSTGAIAAPPGDSKLLERELQLLRKQKRYAECGQRAESYFKRYPDRAWLLIAGDCYELGGDHLNARRLYHRFLQYNSKHGKQDAYVQEVEKRRQRVTDHLRKTHARIEVIAKPSGAQIALGEEGAFEDSPLQRWVRPGKHVVRFRKEGFVPTSLKLEVTAGQQVSRDVALAKRETRGALEIQATPAGAHVFLDGKVVGRAPLTLSQVAPGTHTVLIKAAGHRSAEHAVQVGVGKKTVLEAKLPAVPKKPPKVASGSIATKWWFWTAIGVVVAGGVTAAILLSQPAGEETPAPAATCIWDAKGTGCR